MNNQLLTLLGFIYREEKSQKNAKYIAHKLGTLLHRSGPEVSQLQPAWILVSFFHWSTSQTIVSRLKPPIYKAFKDFGTGTLLKNFFKSVFSSGPAQSLPKSELSVCYYSANGWDTTKIAVAQWTVNI